MKITVGDQIKEARNDTGISQRTLAKRVGISDAFLNHIEQGNREASPSLLIRIFAELGFSEIEFAEILDSQPNTWSVRSMLSSNIDPEVVVAFVRSGRKLSGLSLEQLGEMVNATPTYLEAIEKGVGTPPPAFLVKLVKAWQLKPDIVKKLMPAASSKGAGGFFQRFLVALFEREGFKARLGKSREPDVVVSVGNGIELEIEVKVKYRTQASNK